MHRKIIDLLLSGLTFGEIVGRWAKDPNYIKSGGLFSRLLDFIAEKVFDKKLSKYASDFDVFNDGLSVAAFHGHFHIVKYLVGRIDIHIGDDYALR